MEIRPCERVGGGSGVGVAGVDGGDAAFNADATGGGGGAGTERGQAEEDAPGGRVAPSTVGGLGYGAQVGLEATAAFFGEGWGGDGGFEPVFAWEGRRGRGAGDGGEGLVEGGKVRVALLYNVGSKRHAEGDVELGKGFRVGWRCD